MAKKRVVVLYGGRADEHSISCISTAGVLGAMDTERFEPIPVGITKDGKWIINGEILVAGTWTAASCRP